jgi:hypothetical protein
MRWLDEKRPCRQGCNPLSAEGRLSGGVCVRAPHSEAEFPYSVTQIKVKRGNMLRHAGSIVATSLGCLVVHKGRVFRAPSGHAVRSGWAPATPHPPSQQQPPRLRVVAPSMQRSVLDHDPHKRNLTLAHLPPFSKVSCIFRRNGLPLPGSHSKPPPPGAAEHRTPLL